MTQSPHSTEPCERVSRSSAALAVMVDYLTDLLSPAFNELRAAYGIEPEPPRPGPPVTAEEAKAAADEYWALEALRKEQAETELAEWKALMEASQPRRQHGPRKPTLASVAKQASKAAIAVARYEVKPDGTVVAVVGKQDATVNDDEVENWLSKQKGH